MMARDGLEVTSCTFALYLFLFDDCLMLLDPNNLNQCSYHEQL